MATQFTAADFGMAPQAGAQPQPQQAGPWGANDFAAKPPAPMEGPAQDSIWSSVKTAGARVLNAVGYGWQQGWGSEPLGLSPDTEKSLRDAGVFNDFQNGHTGFVKTANEAVMRPAAAGADAAARLFGGITGVAASLSELQSRVIEGDHPGVVRETLAAPAGATSDLLKGVLGGYIPEFGMLPHGGGEVANVERSAASARSVGIVGEGEAAAYDAAPLTPENIKARTAAAQEAGLEPEQVAPQPASEPGIAAPAPPPVPTVEDVARRIDPETFGQYDTLTAERERLRAELERHQEERGATPEAQAARNDIADLLGVEHEEPIEATIGRETAFRSSASETQIAKLDDAFNRLESALTTDTPEQAALRNQLTGINLALRDLVPDMAKATRNATDIMPDGGESAEAGAREPGQSESAEAAQGHQQGGEPETPAEQAKAEPLAAPVAASPEAQAGVAPANVLGGETLGGETLGGAQKIARGFEADTRDVPQPQGGGETGEHPLQSGDEFDVSDSIAPDGPAPERVRIIRRENGDTAIVTSDGHVIDLTGDLRGGATVEQAIARHLGHDTSGANVTAVEAEGAAETGSSGSETKRPKPRYTNALRPTEGTGELATRGLAKGVEARAVEEGLASRFGDLPEYHRLSMADQAAKALGLIDKDYESAKAIALGDKQPPKGILPETMYVAVEKHALAAGDVETLQQLATRSRLTTAATTMGQRIRTLGERDAASPVGALQEITAARVADAAKRGDLAQATRETMDEARAEVRKAASGVDKWGDFLQSISCSE